jgi:subfamily B ATP-binding cassette protein MsbA
VRLSQAHWGALLGSLLLLAVHALITGAYVYLVGPLLRFIYTGGQSAGHRLESAMAFLGWEAVRDTAELTTVMATAAVALVVIKGVTFFGGTYLVLTAGQTIEHELRTRLYESLLTVSYPCLAELRRGDLISRFVGDVAAVQGGITRGVTRIVRDALQVVVLAALALYLDPYLGLVALGVLPFSSTIIVRIGRTLRHRRRGVYDAYGELAAATEQTATALPVLRTFNSEGHALEQFTGFSQQILKRSLRASALQLFSSPFVELLGAVALAGTLWYAGHRIGQGLLDPEEFVSFFAAVFMLYRPVKSLGEASGTIFTALAAMDRITQILALPREEPDPPRATLVEELNQGIRFEKVSFGYVAEQPVLEDASFELQAGQTVAVVGPSGSGKTTIALLLLRLVEPSQGRITVDGQDLQGVQRTSLRRLFAVVSQEATVLNDTVAANIAFGTKASEADIRQAARAAGAADFIERLPQQYQTSVGESGTRLSGGERQRLCIARALLRDPPALILDEATAAVDSATEEAITQSLEELMQGRTTLLISHRLSTVQRADHIVVVEQGRVVAQGTFDKLNSSCEAFRRLFAGQWSAGRREERG